MPRACLNQARKSALAIVSDDVHVDEGINSYRIGIVILVGHSLEFRCRALARILDEAREETARIRQETLGGVKLNHFALQEIIIGEPNSQQEKKTRRRKKKKREEESARLVHDEDTVRVHDGIEAVGNRDHRFVLKLCPHRLLNKRVFKESIH